MVDFDFGDFIGQVVGQVGGGDGDDPFGNLASIASKAIDDGAARVTSSPSAVAPNAPVVRPTAYVNAQLPNLNVLGFSLSPNQAKLLKVGGVVLLGVVAYKMLKRRK
jgi:hypothetical protein